MLNISQLGLLPDARGIVHILTISSMTEHCCFPVRFSTYAKIETIFASMDGADSSFTAPVIPFDVIRGRLHSFGLSKRDICQFERNDEFMYLQFRNCQIAWLFFHVPELFNKPVPRAALRRIIEQSNLKGIFKALKHSFAHPGHQEKGVELTS
jgi:hypothetical protein